MIDISTGSLVSVIMQLGDSMLSLGLSPGHDELCTGEPLLRLLVSMIELSSCLEICSP